MTSHERDLNDLIVTLLLSISALQAQCGDQNYLLADRLPGLTLAQHRALRAASHTFRSLAEQSKYHANLLKEVTHSAATAASPTG